MASPAASTAEENPDGPAGQSRGCRPRANFHPCAPDLSFSRVKTRPIGENACDYSRFLQQRQLSDVLTTVRPGAIVQKAIRQTMRWPDWLKSLLVRMHRPPKVVTTFDDRGASCRWPDGTLASVTWDDLHSVEIRTTDAGPFAEDVFLVLRAGGGDCAVP